MPSPKSKQRSSSTSLAHLSTGAAVRRGEITISDPMPVDQGRDGHPPSTSAGISAMMATNRQQDATWPRKSTPPETTHVRNASHGQERYELGRASAGPSLIPSSISTAASKSSLSAPRKSSGGFRTALKRMFGSKKGRQMDSRKEYHRSDPGNLTSIMEKQTDGRGIPIPTQAGWNVTRGDALGSHGTAEARYEMPRVSSERKRFKSRSPRRRRRNTLPSLVLTDQEAQILSGPKDDLAERSWRQAEQTPKAFKRRSRSADALNEMAASINLREAPAGDRASQIAYWRTSVIENPTPSYHVWAANQHSDAQTKVPDLAPIQTFDFGLEKPGGEPTSLEDRINTLEIKVFDFEYAIARLQGHDIPKPLLHAKAPKRRSIHELFPPGSDKSTLSVSPIREPTSFLNSPDESPMPASDGEGPFLPDRTSKATTIRPLTARRLSPPRSRPPSFTPGSTPSQLEELLELIKQEREARLKLEQQVCTLQKELEVLRTPVYAEIRPVSYPTPSPESTHETPLAQRTIHRSPRFYPAKSPTSHETSRFSMSDSISTGTATDTEDGFQDVYEAPQENRFVFETSRGSPLIGVS